MPSWRCRSKLTSLMMKLRRKDPNTKNSSRIKLKTISTTCKNNSRVWHSLNSSLKQCFNSGIMAKWWRSYKIRLRILNPSWGISRKYRNRGKEISANSCKSWKWEQIIPINFLKRSTSKSSLRNRCLKSLFIRIPSENQVSNNPHSKLNSHFWTSWWSNPTAFSKRLR